MKISIKQILTGLLSILLVSMLFLPVTNASNGKNATELDINEELHLIFMREEEKLARDVYIRFSEIYSDKSESQVFFNITASETRHTLAVLHVMEKFGVEDPVTSDLVGDFSSEQFGEHFVTAFNALVSRGTVGYKPYEGSDYEVNGLLAAMYVGAFIEELDMHDIVLCPHEVTDYDYQDLIEYESDCGMDYTDEKSIKRLYSNLLDGSASHLRAYVYTIEKFIGEGEYKAQYLDQDEVNEYLGR
ncbi:MAG: DUF2202 domain-containing protein [Gammaproteobacteria bacterium]|nr:DUF2202 domain-containing protein [Gammaproteobacteria bacterium]